MILSIENKIVFCHNWSDNDNILAKILMVTYDELTVRRYTWAKYLFETEKDLILKVVVHEEKKEISGDFN